jgi:hypothetical protein
MAKLYPTKAMFEHKDLEGVKRGLKERTAAVLDEIGWNTTYMVVDAAGCVAGVVARRVYSPAGLLPLREVTHSVGRGR